MRHRIHIVALVAAGIFAWALQAQQPGKDKAALERGFAAVSGKVLMNPPVWSPRGYEQVWKQWGLAEKPADFDKLFRERYGLHAAPYDNGGLPMGLHYSKGILGKGIINDCLLCHAGTIAGQTIIGMGNASLDLQSMFDDFIATDKTPFKFPFRFSYVRGTIDPINPVAFLMEFRTADLSLRPPVKLDFARAVSSDPPAWWLLKRKETRNWTGGVNVNSMRVDMVNLLTPFNSAEHIKKHESTFGDIHEFVMSVEAPKYPFEHDAGLAAKGLGLFTEHCARCHGTYGPKATYPNKVVPLKTLGTDPALAQAITPKNLEFFNRSWFGQEKGGDGWYQLIETEGYQAPPLDGVWATAPYFHNGSVPTVYDVLNSKARPRIFTRSYQTGKDEYDAAKLGWKVRVLEAPPDAKLPGHERRRVYDSTLPGQSKAGHTFGDELTDEERRAVIEYLKTL
jgi:mono/diheme cytochrome c family protein